LVVADDQLTPSYNSITPLRPLRPQMGLEMLHSAYTITQTCTDMYCFIPCAREQVPLAHQATALLRKIVNSCA
jgi:hypothetical protein